MPTSPRGRELIGTSCSLNDDDWSGPSVLRLDGVDRMTHSTRGTGGRGLQCGRESGDD
jgi:hypothetical protein